MVVCFVLVRTASPGAAATDARGRIDVEFQPDGRCHVSATGETFHSSLTYTPHAAPQTSERRCAIPPVPDGTPIELTVRLPPGAARPAGAGQPALAWTRQGDRWVGTATLTSAPAVVRVPAAGDRGDVRTLAVRTIGFSAAAALALAWWLWRRDRAGAPTAP